MELKGDWSPRYNPKEPGKESGETGDPRKNSDHPDHSTAEIGQNTEMSPGKLSRLAVTWNLVKDTSYHQCEKLAKSKITITLYIFLNKPPVFFSSSLIF